MSKWTTEEDQVIRAAYQSGKRLKEVAAQMGKTKNQIIGRAKALGLTKQGNQERAMALYRDDLNQELRQIKLEWYEKNPQHRLKVWGWASGKSYRKRVNKPLGN